MSEGISAAKTAPRRWTPEEETALWEGVRQGTDMPTLAAVMERSVGALESRLAAMGAWDYGAYGDIMTGAAGTAEKEKGEDSSPHDHAWKTWGEDEVGALLAVHHATPTTADMLALAEKLGRTPRALVLKLVQMGALRPALNDSYIPWDARVKARPAPKKKALPPALPAKGAPTVKIKVTAEFQAALQAVEAGENLLILGSAGTGKSTFLKWLRHKLAGKRKMAVVAPTGMAALNIGGQTLHSFFGLKPQLMQGNKHDWHRPRNPKLFAALDLLVVDEISMVRADVLEAVDLFLRAHGPKMGKPFGGVQLLMMGDLCQLPPVVRRDEEAHFEERFGTPFFFSSPSYALLKAGVLPFTEVFRQADVPFITLLNALRMGELSRAELAALNARVVPAAPAGAVVLAARNRTVDAMNAAAMEALSGKARVYNADVTGTIETGNITTPAELVLKPGARVMLTRNDSVAARWVNGSLGTVVRCGDNEVDVRLDDGTTHAVEPVKWESLRYGVDAETDSPVPLVAGTFTQIPLTLAWAVTIHKAQGQTIERVHVNLGDGGTFAEGQLYVALSRAKSLNGLTLSEPILPRHVKTHPAVHDFYAALGLA